MTAKTEKVVFVEICSQIGCTCQICQDEWLRQQKKEKVHFFCWRPHILYASLKIRVVDSHFRRE